MKTTKSTATHGNSTKQSIRLKHFFDTAMKTFSLYDNVRSIPRMTDGLKPSQRKAVCGTLSRGENAGEMQVERLASIIAACFPGETLVTLSNGQQVPISEVVQMFQEGQDIEVLSFDQNTKTFIPAKCTNAFLTKEVQELIVLTLDDGGSVSLTPEHRLLTDRGWVQAKDLSYDDNVLSF
jgi:hypothetical protein